MLPDSVVLARVYTGCVTSVGTASVPHMDPPAKKAKKPRGRNAVALAARNPFEFDNAVSFDENTHTYTVNGLAVHASVSDAVKVGFADGGFNASLVIRKNLSSWRARPEHKLHQLVAGKSDAEATSAVTALWENEARLGTLIHKWAEEAANGAIPSEEGLEDMAREKVQILNGWGLLKKRGLSICRTEHSLFYPPVSPKVGGQADLLMLADGGAYAIVDLKRTQKDLSPGASSYGRVGVGCLAGVPDTPHHRYSLQQSCYAVMFEDLTGEKVESTYLLQVHGSLAHPRVIQCTDLRAEARALLDSMPPTLPGCAER